MKILLSGGGTAGHINPAIAIAKYIRARRPSAEILFIGAVGGMEEKLVPEAGFELKTFRVSGLQRGFSPKALAHNVRSARLLLAAMKQVDAILDEFKPDAVLGTGGFACFPPLWRAAKRGIPTLVHESNVLPGRTNRMLARRVDKVLLGFADAERYIDKKDRAKIVVTGNPLREGMVFCDRAEAKRSLGITGPLVYSVWGSLGAREMNKVTAELIALEAANDAPWTHIHSTGSFGFQWMPELIASMGVDLSKCPKIDMREYVYNAPEVLAAADLILCRAGAMTMSEVCATGTPAIIVPSPNVSEHHQHKNAHALTDRGAAILDEEGEFTAAQIYEQIDSLLKDPKRLADMRAAALELAVFDAGEKIYACITELIGEK